MGSMVLKSPSMTRLSVISYPSLPGKGPKVSRFACFDAHWEASLADSRGGASNLASSEAAFTEKTSGPPTRSDPFPRT